MQRTNSNNNHICFDEISKQVCNLKNVILGDIERGFERSSTEDSDNFDFTHHKLVTKSWFMRVSSSNKKRFITVLLEDVRSAWTLSLLLKSIWNCRPKDAVPSAFEAWSIYDQHPLDHNRTAMPLKTLVEVMETERMWFRTLEPYNQAELLSELLKCAGGPIVWAVFHKAQTIFERYRDYQLQNIQECAAVGETQERTFVPVDDKGKKETRPKPSAGGGEAISQVQDGAHRELETQLAQWNSIIKSMKDSQKLEEVELSFSDGTTKRIWKINRPKPEVSETVDYLQLLPLSVAKQILNYVPRTQLNDCARVNKYWAYLVDEFKAELAARLKIDMEIKKLTDLMLRNDHDNHDSSINQFPMATTGTNSYVSKLFRNPTANSGITFEAPRSQKFGTNSVFRKILRDTKTNKRAQKLPPIRRLADLSETLERRGAADDSLWDWCKKVLDLYKKPDIFPPLSDEQNVRSVGSAAETATKLEHAKYSALEPMYDFVPVAVEKAGPWGEEAREILGVRAAIKREGQRFSLGVMRRPTWDGVMAFRHIHFPCPLMTKNIVLPLKPALSNNFTTVASLKQKGKSSNIHKTQMYNLTKKKCTRYSIWSKDFSSLYVAVKIPNYKSPV